MTPLVELFSMALSLPTGAAVYATPGFEGWLGGSERKWPPPANAAGLCLVDTRDAEARRFLRGLTGSADCSALLVLARGASGWRSFELALRDIRHGLARRVREPTIRARLSPSGDLGFEQPLYFHETAGAPTTFYGQPRGPAMGAAVLMSRAPMLHGPLWQVIRDELGDQLVLEELQLRHRGAAVIMIETRRGSFVVRFVPEPSLLEVVERNHSVLLKLRDAVQHCPEVASRIPVPLFSERVGPGLVLGETRLPGSLAWKLASSATGPIIYNSALSFLDALERATKATEPLRRGATSQLLMEEVARVEGADFVPRETRGHLVQELRLADRVLSKVEVVPYASHGDFGYGNILVDAATGQIGGVIDWDTARFVDLPGVDRINMEVQIRRGGANQRSLAAAAQLVWRERAGQKALEGPGHRARVRALFGAALCRMIARSFSYPDLYRAEATQFDEALRFLGTLPPEP